MRNLTEEELDRVENGLAIVKIIAFFAMMTILGVAALRADAAPVVDQYNSTYDTTFSWGTATNGGNTRTVCQSFVPTQPTLVQVDLAFSVVAACGYASDKVKFYVSSGACKGQGGDTTLSSHALTSDEWTALTGTSPYLTNWTLDSPISVTPGTTYYISMRDEIAANLCYRTSENSSSSYGSGIERRGNWTDTFADHATKDLFFGTYYDGLYVTVSATNTPAASGGIRWSGYGTLPADLEAGEYTTNFFTRIFSEALNVDRIFSINSSSSTNPGYYETPATALGISWAPGSYTVVTTQTTNQRTSSATTTVTVLSYPGAPGVPVGGGGGSWGDEGLPSELVGGVPVDGGLGQCLADTFATDALEMLTNPLEVFVRIYDSLGCFLNSALSVFKGIAPWKWMFQIGGYWTTAVTSATGTLEVTLTRPDTNLGAGSNAGTIALVDTASSSSGIGGQLEAKGGDMLDDVHALLTTALYLVFGFYLLRRALDHKFI